MARGWIIAGVLGAAIGGGLVFLGGWLATGTWPKLPAREMERGAAALPAPPPPNERRMIVGFRQYDAACIRCHSAPGEGREPWADGLDPLPRDLSQPGGALNTRELFWIICHGEEASGMPSWRAHRSDDEIWDLALFVHALPGLAPGRYQALRANYGPAPAPFGLTPDASCLKSGRVRLDGG